MGLGAILFLLFLTVTGVALNHTEQLRLDERFVGADWLLGWYGMEAPAPSASFATARGRVTLMGNRLYVDTREAARNIDALVGAAAYRDLLVVASPDRLLFVDATGVVDDIAFGVGEPRLIDAIAIADGRLYASDGTAVFAYDELGGNFEAAPADSTGIEWVRPSVIPPALLTEIASRYRGEGVSVERVLYDIHSGRLLGGFGVWLMDIVALGLIVLACSGLLMWIRR